MQKIATTIMSSKGQVIIPEEIRRRLKLKTGAQFVVVGDNNAVILKNISPPSIEEFDELIIKVRKIGQQAGLNKNDIKEAIMKVRGTK
jgi:AbrB family looped-hinge helix DNA binding protein